MKRTLPWVAVSVLALLVVTPAAAVIDGEVELRYLDAEFETDDGTGSEASAPGAALRAELVFIKRLAFAGEISGQQGEEFFEDVTFGRYQLDAKWRFLAPSKNTYLGVGVGYEKYDVSDDENDESITADGTRLVIDGSFNFIKILKVYGRAAYLPSLGDLKVDGLTLAEGDSGYDVDLGLGIYPIPFLSIWVGYRTEQLDFKDPLGSGAALSLKNSGPYLGAGIRF